MKKIIYFMLAFLFSVVEAKEYSLNSILFYSTKHSNELEMSRLAYKEGKQQIRFYRSEALPYIKFSSGASYTSTSMKAQLDAFGFGGDESKKTSVPDLSNITDPAVKNAFASLYSMLGNMSSGMSADDRSKGITWSWDVNLMQPLITFGKVRSALKAAYIRNKMLDKKKQLDFDLFYLKLIGDFSKTFTYQNEVDVLSKSVDRAKRLLDFMESNYTAGLASEIDKLRLEGYTHGQEASLLKAKMNYETSLRRLATMSGFSEIVDGTLVLDSTVSVFEMPEVTSDDSSLGCIIGDYGLKLKDSEVKYERSKLFPSIYLVAGASNRYTAESDNDLSASELFDGDYISYHVGLQLSWTVFDGFRTPAHYKEVKYQKSKLTIEQNLKNKENRTAINEAQELVKVLNLTEKAMKKQLDAASKALVGVEDDFKSGNADVTKLLDVEKQFYVAKKSVNDIKVQKILAIANLRLMLGKPLRGSAK